MEKLIVKNFGPIKEAEIDLTKFIVFIGDTSTGKSVLAKLIAIFRDSLFVTKVTYYQNEKTKTDISYDFDAQLIKLNINFDYSMSYIHYISDVYSFEINAAGSTLRGTDLMYTKYNETVKEDVSSNRGFIEVEKNGKKGFVLTRQVNPSYFPAERILISIVGQSIAGLWANNVALPGYLKNFAAMFETSRLNKKKVDYLQFGFKYSFENNTDIIHIGKLKYELTRMSSGIQSLVPMLVTFDREIKFKNRTLVLEEPELNLFPVKQKILLEYLIGRLNETDNNIVITTHSPYTLSCLNTLLLAKNVYNEKPEYKERINKIVPENIWIDYDDISVYEVKKGKVKLLKNEEFKSIETNIIDEVSGVISSEFDELLDLRYE